MYSLDNPPKPTPAGQRAPARHERNAAEARSMSAKPRKSGQRERILEAVVELAAEVGYQNVSVAQISSRARVSATTFYEQFEDKEDCFLAAYNMATRRLLDSMPLTVDEGGWPGLLSGTINGLLRTFQRYPAAGRIMLIEVRAAGPRLREARRRVTEELGRRLGQALGHPSEDSKTLDLPATALVGAMRSIIAEHMRDRAEDELPALAEDVLVWLRSYAIPDSAERWSAGPQARLPAAVARRSTTLPLVAERLPRGRHGLSAGVVARSQRTRIIQGMAEVMLRKGYAETTVADIVAAAGVARHIFYEHFTNKQDAFLMAQQHGLRDLLDACATAYFHADEWPERVWRLLRTLLDAIASNPPLAHLRLVECYAAGDAAVRRAEEVTRSFTTFLEEGYRYRDEARSLPRLCSEAITGAVFEIIQRQVARGKTADLRSALPLLTYIALAPFAGPADAIRQIEALSQREADPRRLEH
jgi:AcrR family transcriptional regulator